MTPQDNKVLACVDLSPCAEHVADAAAWAAARMGAPLEFLHVIDRHPALRAGQDRSGAIGANAQEKLLQALSEEDAARTRAERELARGVLQGLRARAEAAGACPVDTRQRHGDLEETLSEQQAGVGLFVLGRSGASAAQPPHALGRHLEWTVRALQRPILVAAAPFQRPQRVLIAFDGSALTRKGVAMVAASALLKGLPLHLLMAGRPARDASRQMEWARQTLAQAGFEVTAGTPPGDPATVIGQAIEDHGIGLLVMGAYTHSPLRRLFMGSQTIDLLRAARVPTLLLR